jgi:hypothetical protein
MKLIKITLNMAFHDVMEATAANVWDAISDTVVDQIESEVTFTTNELETTVDIPDPDWEAGNADEQIEAWQAKAEDLLRGL